MGMVKIVSPSGWDFDVPSASMIKIASGGLRGFDRREFIKRAASASNIFLPYLDNIKIAKDVIPVHLIALGASEAYGPNRNGDGFKEAVCKAYHDTFVKYARFYRNHKNKDPDISYGRVLLSGYNPEMRRTELLVGLNATKAAADMYGGFVADREIEKLARDEDLCVSMACRVPYDSCSFCGNKARTRDEYCTASMCKAGGCAENLTRLLKIGNDTHHLHVDNHYPTWFDISDVFRPADRIAWGSRADYLTKAAADHGFFGTDGAKLAEDLGVTAPLQVIIAQHMADVADSRLIGQLKLAHGMAALQKQAMDGAAARLAFTAAVQPPLDWNALGAEDGVKTACLLGALADRKIVVPLRDFANLTKRAGLTTAAANRLLGVYDRMVADGSLERRLLKNAHAPAQELATAKQRAAAEALTASHSLEKSAVERRAMLAAIRPQSTAERSVSGSEKSAADEAAAEELARDYACYKVAALERIAASDPEFILTARFAEWQNRAV